MATKYEYLSGTPAENYICETTYVIGQSFTIGNVGTNENFNIYSVKVQGYVESGSSPGIITCAIRAVDGSGYPTGPDLSTGTVDSSTMGEGAFEEIEFLMSSYTLQASTQYVFLIKKENDGVNTTFVFGAEENYNDASYTGGTCLHDDGGWASVGFDAVFEIWGTAGTPAATGTGQYINIDDNLKEISEIYVNVDDSFKEVTEAYVNVDDSFKKLF